MSGPVARHGSVDEFMAELSRDVHAQLAPPGEVERGIVRVTQMVKPRDGLGGAVGLVYVVVGYVAGGRLVECRKFVGEHGWETRADEATAGTAQEVMQRIEHEVRELGLEVRHGMFEMP